MRARRRWLALAACCACSLLAGVPVADAADEPVRLLPFSDDIAPPPPLPTPLDRHFRGKIESFDGDRIAIHWSWATEDQLEDFEPFVPVRSTLSGGFVWKEGRLEASGTGGLRLRLGLIGELEVETSATLHDPHDIGIVLPVPRSSDESILCLVQDRLFTRFDSAAGNANMINKVGGIPVVTPGYVEFRYVDRRMHPELAPGARVKLHVVRKNPHTAFTIDPGGGEAVTLQGRDTDTAFERFTPGLYTSGGAGDFGELRISGRIDPAWLTEHRVLPHVASDLLHAGNRFKGAEKKAAETVERFLLQDPSAEPAPKKLVAPATVAAYVGDVKLPLVIRIRAAESLTEKGLADGTVAERVAGLLDAKDAPARVLAWQVLRAQLPWHFHYDVDAEPKVRREAALLVGAYLRERDDAEAQGKVFVEGYWYTAARADAIRGEWDRAWDLRTPRVRVRTNLAKEWADWHLAALEAEYRELVRLVGREPPPEMLPLSVLVFAKKDEFATFCNGNGYEAKAAWSRFVDLERNSGFTVFDRKDAPYWALTQAAKLFLRSATGRYWPSWFEEGRAAYFGNPEIGAARWDGTTLQVGLQGRGSAARKLAAVASQGRLPSVEAFLVQSPHALEGDALALWYAQAWGLHQWFLTAAPEPMRQRFADWQGVMENLDVSPRAIDEVGRKQLHLHFDRDWAELERLFLEWASKL